MVCLLEEVEIHLVREQAPYSDIELPLVNHHGLLDIFLEDEFAELKDTSARSLPLAFPVSGNGP